MIDLADMAMPRRSRHEVSRHGADNSNVVAAALATCDALFDTTEHCREPPRDRGSPSTILGQKPFFAGLEACVEPLPDKLARVFMKRVFASRGMKRNG
ncbi:hypothetical protein [Mycetohabitans sp. B46]|uniref:hypothetical protein n=1 Tax=Mycetohabitans sp. B46 TaxID=2772536 RepID=UPI00307D1599